LKSKTDLSWSEEAKLMIKRGEADKEQLEGIVQTEKGWIPQDPSAQIQKGNHLVALTQSLLGIQTGSGLILADLKDRSQRKAHPQCGGQNSLKGQ
jgi:hypothetical protein